MASVKNSRIQRLVSTAPALVLALQGCLSSHNARAEPKRGSEGLEGKSHAVDPVARRAEMTKGTLVAPAQPASALQVGVDVLAAENFARLRGARVALLTNDTARTADGTRSLDA